MGQVDYFKSLLKEAGLEKEAEEHLRALISEKNYFGVEELVEEQKLSPQLAAVFQELPHLFGSVEVPVSYTHLDVYKRQRLCRPFFFWQRHYQQTSGKSWIPGGNHSSA